MTLKKKLVSGVMYTGISKYAGILISLVITAILSRILTPDDFGTVAIATVIITFFGVFSDFGIAPAIIQNKELDEEDLSGLFSFTVWLGLFFSALLFLFSEIIGSYYNSAVLVNICRILSLSLFFNTINIVPNALLYKDKAFKFLAKRTLIVQFAAGSIAIIAAFSGAGIYSLLINPVLSSIIIFCITFKRYPQRFVLSLGLRPLKKIFSFSLYQFLFNVINYFSRNIDKLLIGRHMGMVPLGYYEKSYRLMMLPLQNITYVITPVMHPIFSDFQRDLKKLESSYLRVVRLLAFIGLPLSVFLLFTAKELVLIIFGSQWEASIPVFQILAISVGIQIILSTSGSIFQSANDTKSLFICGLFSAITNVGGIFVGVFFFQSLTAVAWAIVITFTINFLQTFLQMYYVTFKLPMKSFYKTFISPLLLSLILFLLFSLFTYYVPIQSMIGSLLVNGALFLIVVGLYIQWSNEYDLIKKIKGFFSNVF